MRKKKYYLYLTPEERRYIFNILFPTVTYELHRADIRMRWMRL